MHKHPGAWFTARVFCHVLKSLYDDLHVYIMVFAGLVKQSSSFLVTKCGKFHSVLFFIIFHWFLHACMNARSRKRLVQDALFFDGFAFRHRKTTKKWTFRFFSGVALSLHVRSKSLGCQTAQIGTGTVFPAPLPLCGVLPQQWVRCSVFASCNAVRNFFLRSFQAWSIPPVCTLTLLPSRMSASARDEVGRVASRMCASARDEVGSVASPMCASASNQVGSVASRMSASARDEVGSVASPMCASASNQVGSVASRMSASARDEVGNVASRMSASAIERYQPTPPHPTPSCKRKRRGR